MVNCFSFPCNFKNIHRSGNECFYQLWTELIFENLINEKKGSARFSGAKNKLDKISMGRGRRENLITRKYEMVSRLRISPHWNQA